MEYHGHIIIFTLEETIFLGVTHIPRHHDQVSEFSWCPKKVCLWWPWIMGICLWDILRIHTLTISCIYIYIILYIALTQLKKKSAFWGALFLRRSSSIQRFWGRQLLPQRVLPQQQRRNLDLGAANGSADHHLRGWILSLPSSGIDQIRSSQPEALGVETVLLVVVYFLSIIYIYSYRYIYNIYIILYFDIQLEQIPLFASLWQKTMADTRSPRRLSLDWKTKAVCAAEDETETWFIMIYSWFQLVNKF